MPSDAQGDIRLMLLASEHRRAQAALCDWIDAAERRLGPLGYEEPPYRARYDALCARADWLVAELARTRPDGILGFAAKLRASVCYDYAGEIPLDCDSRLLPPILDDLDRLAAGALSGGG